MTSSPRSVVVLAGGISHERDVSLRSGRRVADSLAVQGGPDDVGAGVPEVGEESCIRIP